MPPSLVQAIHLALVARGYEVQQTQEDTRIFVRRPGVTYRPVAEGRIFLHPSGKVLAGALLAEATRIAPAMLEALLREGRDLLPPEPLGSITLRSMP